MPTDATLTKTERNIILREMQEIELNPSEFEWSHKRSDEYDGFTLIDYNVSCLTHIGTGFYFKFGGLEDEWSPGTDRKVSIKTHNHSWQTKLTSFYQWGKRVKEEIEAPDLWAAILQSKKLAEVAATPDTVNTPFSDTEQKYIAEKLTEIERYLTTTEQINAEHRQFVHNQFKYLAESSERLGRKDWHMTLMGVLTSIVISAVFAPQRTEELFRMVAEAFLPLFKHILQLPAVPM